MKSIVATYLIQVALFYPSHLHGATAMPDKIVESAPIVALRNEDAQLRDQVDALKVVEDKWNNRNIALSILGVVIGGCVALGFGGGVYFSQRKATKASKDARPLQDRRDAIASDIRNRLDTEAAKQIAEAQVSAGVANQKAEAEKLDRIKLEATIAPRRLSAKQLDTIRSTCLGLYGRRLLVRSNAQDVEAALLAKQLAIELHGIGFDVKADIGYMAVTGEPDTGIRVDSPPEDLEFANCLAKALTGLEAVVNAPKKPRAFLTQNAIGLSLGGAPMTFGPLKPGSPVEITVGAKPIAKLYLDSR